MAKGETQRAQNANAVEFNTDAFRVADNPLFPTASQYKVSLHLPPSARSFNVKLTLQNLIPKPAVRGQLDGQKLHQSKAHSLLPNTPQYKLLLYLPLFGRNSIDNKGRPN